MARFTFRLPDIGEGIAEAEIVAWHVRVGERVEEDQQVADMMTDKATVEMESPVSGVVVELAGEVGDQVAIGSALMVVETDGDEAPVSEEVEEQVEAENPGVEEVTESTAVRAEPVEAPSSTSPEPKKEEQPFDKLRANGGEGALQKHVLASPAVRARAKDLGIDLASVKAEGDRLRHSDLDAYLRYGQGEGYYAPHASRAREDEPVKVIGMRRRIAENMAASKRAIPHFTYVDEVDVTALEELEVKLAPEGPQLDAGQLHEWVWSAAASLIMPSRAIQVFRLKSAYESVRPRAGKPRCRAR